MRKVRILTIMLITTLALHSAAAFCGEYFVTFSNSTDLKNAKPSLSVIKTFKHLNILLIKSAMKPQVLKALAVEQVPRIQPNTKSKNSNKSLTSDFVSLAPALPLSFSQWMRDPKESWGLWASGAIDAHQRTRGQGAKIMLIDGGITLNHPDFFNAKIIARDFKNTKLSQSHPYPVHDIAGHGTHIAGTLVGAQFGVAPEATLYVARAGDFLLDISAIVEALNWAIAVNVDVISLSSNSLSFPKKTAQFIYATLEKNNIVVVASAGNLTPGQNMKLTGIPKSLPHTLTVGASNQRLLPADFSVGGKSVSLCAPGVDILSASLTKGMNSTDTLAIEKSGTSMAVPHVAGAVALIRSLYPNSTAQEIRDILKSTASPIESADLHPLKCGHGNLNIMAALGRAFFLLGL